MSMSGIDVDDDLKTEFAKMKQNKLETPMQLLVMQLSDDKKKVVKKPDLCMGTCTHQELLDFFSHDDMRNDCCYAVYDFNNKKLVLIKWAPDSGPASKKMIYASTFGTIKTAFEGVKNVIEATDLDDLTEKDLEKNK